VRYHERVRPSAAGLVVATFAQLTTDFGEVTQRVNERFGVDLPVFDHSPENIAAVYRPDDPDRAARRGLAATRRPEAEAPALAPLRARAVALYGAISPTAG
jgi:hypothetical protein